MRGWLTAALASLAVGCTQSDPCAGVTGTCLALEVRWRTSGPTVEQIEVEGTRGLTLPPDSRTPPTAKETFSLPVVVPLVAGTLSGDFAVAVRALRLGVVVGEGAREGRVSAREHRRFVVELDLISAGDAGASDDGGLDGGVADGPSVDFSRDDATPCTVPSSDEVWVDDDAPDGGTGSIDCPFPTVSEALALARTSPSPQKQIHLRPGVYEREQFPLMVRDGISLVGDTAGSTLIRGTGPWSNDGDTAFPPAGVALTATIVVGTIGAENRIEHLTVAPETTLIQADFTHAGIVCDRGNAPSTIGAGANPPNVMLDDVEAGPRYTYGAIVSNTFSLAVGCNLRVVNSRFVGGHAGVHAIGKMNGTAQTVPVSLELGLASGSGNLFIDSGLISFPGPCAVGIFDDVSPALVRFNQFTAVGCGVLVSSTNTAAIVQINDNTMSDLRYHGIALTDVTRALVTSNRISNVDYNLDSPNCVVHAALCLTDQAQVVARANFFVGNHAGVALRGDGLSMARVIDLGRTGNLGGNTMACNSRLANDPGHDLDVFLNTNSMSSDPILAVGNNWDHVPLTEGPNNGDDLYITGSAIQPVINPAGGAVYMAQCPIGRIP